MKVKGTSIASFLSFIEAEYGAQRSRDFLASLDSALRKRCDGLVLASAFYPMEELETIVRKARDHFHADASFFERSGAHNATFGLTGVHQALLARSTPIDFLRAAERAWTQFADSGTASVHQVGDGEVRISIEGLPHSEIFCARITGFVRRALEMAGAKSLTVTKTKCRREGHPHCEWRAVWDPATSPRPIGFTSTIKRPTL